MNDSTPGNPFRKVFAGQKINITAKAWNTLMNMAEGWGGNGGSRGFGAGPAAQPDPEGLVWVQNNSGSDVDRASVLGVSGVLISDSENLDEFLARICLVGVTPTTASHAGKFVVTYEPIANGAIGRAYASGAFPAKIYMNSSSDKWADVKDSDATQLNSGSSGSAQILWVASGTGTQWGIVRIRNGSDRHTPSNLLDLTYTGSHAEAIGQTYDAAFDLVAGLGSDGSGNPYDGVKVSRTVGVAYYDSGDQKVYEYRVDEVYDTLGRLCSRTAAYRVTVVTTC